MYIITLTLYVYPYTIFKWVAENEEDANAFMEKAINLLDMTPHGVSWYKKVNHDSDLGIGGELLLDIEEVDTVYSDNLKETLADYIVNPEYA